MGKLDTDELMKDKARIKELGGVNLFIWTNKLNKH